MWILNMRKNIIYKFILFNILLILMIFLDYKLLMIFPKISNIISMIFIVIHYILEIFLSWLIIYSILTREEFKLEYIDDIDEEYISVIICILFGGGLFSIILLIYNIFYISSKLKYLKYIILNDKEF